jgi:bacillithiol biosynthesis cysteine-adding enzyme BshC
VTAPDSSSSETNQLFDLDLLATGRLAPLPSAFLRGKDRDLLEPLRFFDSGFFDPVAGLAGLPLAAAPASRPALAAALGEANQRYGHLRAAELARKLADPATRVVVSGQQPGLWGGPLLGLVKALAASRYAAEVERAGKPAVAIFWVASEDHDWAEVTRASLPGRQGNVTVELGADPRPLLPLADREWGETIAEADAKALEALGGGPTLERWQREIAPLFAAEAGLAESFCRLFAAIMGEHAPLLLDATLPALKEAEKPFLRRLIEERHRLDAAYAAAEARVEARGYSLQVKPQRGVSPLFLVRGGERRRIEFPGPETWALRGVPGSEAPIEELLAIADRDPASLSPGVLARPAIQDAALGTSLQVMGPAELSYLVQASAAHELLGLSPATTLRPQALLLEDRQAGWLEELGLPLAELLSQPVAAALTARLGGNLVEPLRRELSEKLDLLRQPLLDLDGSLEAPWRKSREQIERTLEQLEQKVTASAARRHEVQLRRLEQVKAALLPEETLQERVIATGYFYARFGAALAPALLRGLDLGARRLSVIRLGAAGAAPAPAEGDSK